MQVHRFLDKYEDDEDAVANTNGYASDDDDVFSCALVVKKGRRWLMDEELVEVGVGGGALLFE